MTFDGLDEGTGHGLDGLILDGELVGRLRADLRMADWTVDRVDRLLSPMAKAAMERDQLVPAALELEGVVAPSATLTRLFVLAEPVSRQDVDAALPTLGAEGARRLGLVDLAGGVGGDVVVAKVDLRPHSAQIPVVGDMGEVVDSAVHEWWIASDLSQAQTGEPPAEDYVLGIAAATTNLLGLTMRQRVGAAMDLGCGCGVLALYLAKHADRVVATDISARACQLTRFNALLNEIELDVRQGSLFEPVEGEQFDLITSNPPFVITPQSVRERLNLEYRDGGLERDSLIPLVIKQSVGHLNPGGVLQMLANWEIQGDPDGWAVRPSDWVEEAAAPVVEAGGDVDAWVVQRDLVDVAQYAEWWMRDALGDGVPKREWAREYREWLNDFRAARVAYVGLGSLALRVGAARGEQVQVSHSGTELTGGGGDGGRLNLVCEYLPDGPPVDGAAVRCALDNLVLPDDWATRRLRRGEDVREVRYFVPGSVDPELIRVTQGRPGGRDRTVASSVAALIGVSEGELTPEQVIPAISHLMGEDPDTTRMQVEEALPELLRSGVLSKE